MKTCFLPLLCCFLPMSLLFAQKTPPGQPSRAEYEALFPALEANPSDSLLGRLYDQILLFQNASIDKEIMLRQKMRYADRETLQLFKTKDSLLTRVGRAYELPPAQRPNTVEMEKRAAEITALILNRVQQGHDYYLALSVKFARQVYDNDPSMGNLACYTKISAQKGNDKLASQLKAYAIKKERSALRWQQVRNELTDSEVAIEFVAYHSSQTNATRYGALLLRRGYQAPRYVALCPQADLDEVLQKGKLDEAYYQQILYRPPSDNEGPTLYELIWKPLEPLLKNAKKVYYAPAGDLHRLNIAAMSAAEQAPPLQDQYEFIRINSTRSLINIYGNTVDKQAALPAIKMPCVHKTVVSEELISRFFGSIAVDYYDPTVFRNNQEAVLFGNIYYDMDSLAMRNPDRKAPYSAKTTTPPKQARQRRLNQAADWDFLYGTKTEIDALQAMLRKSKYEVRLLEGYAASEEAFKALDDDKASPRIVHIATHGFFLADTAEQNADHPLNRSGLVLAGANHAWKKGKPLQGMEDGILSAFEISALHLQNTELVVLSACETGLGHIVNNEGVFGLQRAFKQAGVKNLMVSLWSIPDKATQLLMTQFYQNCLEADMTMRQALKAAQQWMRAQENYQNPYYWAGFVLLE